MNKEISIIGWWCVFAGQVPVAVLANELLAKEYAEFKQYQYKGIAEGHFQIKQITAKVDFTAEQIQVELSKRVDKVQAVCFENPKL